MHPAEEKLGRLLSWLLLLGGVSSFVFGCYSLASDGYDLTSLWMAGGGLVLVLAFGSTLMSHRT